MPDPLDTPAAIRLGLDLAADFARQTPDDRDDRTVALCRKVLTEPAAEVLIDKLWSAAVQVSPAVVRDALNQILALAEMGAAATETKADDTAVAKVKAVLTTPFVPEMLALVLNHLPTPGAAK